MKLTLLFIGMLAATCAAEASRPLLAPLEIKGVALDMPMEQIVLLYPEFDKTCSKQRGSLRTTCMHSIPKDGENSRSQYSRSMYARYPGLQTFGGAQIDYFVISYFDTPRADEITIKLQNSKWSSVSDALIAKFGPPESEIKSVVQNRYGANFDQLELIWTDGKDVLSLTKIGADVDSMRVFLAKKGPIAKQIEAEKANAKNL